MSFMRKNWYYVGGVLFVILGAVLAATWSVLSVPQRVLLMSFMVLLVHQLEEYAWPGGFPRCDEHCLDAGKGGDL